MRSHCLSTGCQSLVTNFGLRFQGFQVAQMLPLQRFDMLIYRHELYKRSSSIHLWFQADITDETEAAFSKTEQ